MANCGLESKNIRWVPRTQRGLNEYEHMHSIFEKTGTRPADYIIAPDWESEDKDPTPSFQRRRFRPWAFEFSGARYWPQGSAEGKLNGRLIKKKPKEPETTKGEQMVEELKPKEQKVEIGQAPEWRPEVEQISPSVGEPIHARMSRIPPHFRQLWVPKHLPNEFSTSSQGLPIQKIPNNPLSASLPVRSTNSAPGVHFRNNEFIPNLRPATSSVKLPYLNFANSQWMSTFNVD